MVEHFGAVSKPSVVVLTREHAARMSLPEVARFLQNILSARLVAYAIGSDSTELIRRIGHGDESAASPEVKARLRCTYAVVLLLLHFDAPATVQAWFIGMSPELDDTAPAEAVRDGRFDDAMGAARAFIAHG